MTIQQPPGGWSGGLRGGHHGGRRGRRRPRWERRRSRTAGRPQESGRWLHWWLAAASGFLLLVGHYLYWYSPRPRQGAPKAHSFAADLLASDDYQACLWLAYPHQNLGFLADQVGEADRYLAAVAEVAGLAEMEVPRFGPFRAPPAKEIVVASAAGGDRFVVAARVYPALSLVARLAGKVASNPWLAGGEVELSGRPARVRWRGSLWLLEPRDEVAIDVRVKPGPTSPRPPALSRLRLTRATGLLPAGTYRLVEQETGVELIGEGDWRPPEIGDPLPEQAVALLFASATAGDGLLRRGAQAGVLARRGNDSSLPGAAVLSRPGGKRWKLPGERIIRRLRGELPTAEVAGWRLTAFDDESLRAAQEVATRLAPLAAPPTASGSTAPARALWVNPGPAAQLVDELATTIETIPFVGRSHARRWRAWATVLEPWADYGRLTVVIGHRSDQMRWRLER